MLYIATNTDLDHGKMGYILKLTNGYGTPKSPFKPIDATNFRAGRLTMYPNGTILQTGASVDFPESGPNETEFKTLLNGEVQILS